MYTWQYMVIHGTYYSKRILSFFFLWNADRFGWQCFQNKKISQIYMVALVRPRPRTQFFMTFSVSHLPQYLLHDIEICESLNKWETKEPLWAFHSSEMLAEWNELFYLSRLAFVLLNLLTCYQALNN